MSTGRAEFIEQGGHAVCLHPERWQMVLDEIKAARAEAKAEAAIITMKLDAIAKDKDDHSRTLYGNGKAGLKETVSKHDQILTALVWTTGTLVAAMIVTGVGLTIRAIFRGLS